MKKEIEDEFSEIDKIIEEKQDKAAKKDIEKHWHYLRKQPFEVAWEVLGPVISRNIPFPPKDKNANHTWERFKKNETSIKKPAKTKGR